MKNLRLAGVVLVLLGLHAGGAQALEIQVAPSTLVLSSDGGKFTVHTDVPYALTRSVQLEIDGIGLTVRTFADDCGNLVAQCTKEAAKEVIGDFEGKSTTVTVTLTVNVVAASESLRVIRGAPQR